MLYDGKPVELTPEQEEVASMFAVMKETDYMQKPIFLKNFWDGFKEMLGKKHVIKDLDKCDFTPMYDYFNAQREAKKAMTKEVRLCGHHRGSSATFGTSDLPGQLVAQLSTSWSESCCESA